MVQLAELDILKDTQQDVRALKWADPSHRDAARLYFSIKHAREEITHLNIEIRHILTAMYDSHADYMRAIRSNVVTNPPLAYELSHRWAKADRLNVHVANQLRDTAGLAGFTGKLETGQRIGRAVNPDLSPLPTWAFAISKPAAIPASNSSGEDQNEDAVVQLTDFMENLAAG